MKKTTLLIMTLICFIFLAGCNKEPQPESATYSFYGEHEYFTLSNGSVSTDSEGEVFDGGYLHITQSGVFEEVTSFTTTFYTLTDNKQRTVMSNSVTDLTGGTITVEGDTGKASGKGVIIDSKAKDIDELKENLWFELKTTDLNGTETVYRIKLVFTE